MGRTTAFLPVVILALTACGSPAGDGLVTADNSSAVTVAGADSAIDQEGDVRPEGEIEDSAVVAVLVDVPEGAALTGTAIVALEDVTVADAAAVEIARVELPVVQLLEQQRTVEVFLPLPLDGTLSITATAHIDVDESGSFSQGDWISPDIVSVSDGTSTVTVSMVQI